MRTFSGCYLERPQDVIFQRPEDVGRGRPQDLGRRCPVALHSGLNRDVHRTSFGYVLRTPLGHDFAGWVVVVEFLDSSLRTFE